MDDIILSLYGTHNDAALDGVYKAAEKIASEYGDEGVELFEQWLDQVPAGAIFDLESTPEKTASELDEESYEKIAEADFLGRVFAHAAMQENARREKIAEYVADGVYEAFIADHTEQE